MKKTNKLNVILTVAFVIAIIATTAEIISCIKGAKVLNWLPISAMFSAFALAFSSLDNKRAAKTN